MIDITDGFTSITAGADAIASSPRADAGEVQNQSMRSPTGVRVTLKFGRSAALPPDQPVRVQYEFGDEGRLREAVGIATPTFVEARWVHAVVYHYRLSHWIAPGALMATVPGNVRQRTEAVRRPRHDSAQSSVKE
jgi:hypothetical protein